jgi:carbon storage regulator
MLVLTRKKEEEIIIGGGIVVKVIEIHGDRVKLGFSAPPTVTIDRSEVVIEKAKTTKKDGHGVERQTS